MNNQHERDEYNRRDSEYNRREEASSTTKLTYLAIGGGIGAILALLFAPKAGNELRGDIADATRKGIEKSKETAALVGEKAGDYYEVSREKAGELYSTAQDKAGELYSTAQDKAGELYQTAQVKAGELGEKAKGAVSSASNPFSAALEAGKEAYSQEKKRTSDTEALPEARQTYPVKEPKALDAVKDKDQENKVVESAKASDNSKDKDQNNKSAEDNTKDKEKRG